MLHVTLQCFHQSDIHGACLECWDKCDSQDRAQQEQEGVIRTRVWRGESRACLVNNTNGTTHLKPDLAKSFQPRLLVFKTMWVAAVGCIILFSVIYFRG